MAQEQYQKIGLIQTMIGTILYEERQAENPNQELIEAAKGSRTMLRRLEKQLRRKQKEK